MWVRACEFTRLHLFLFYKTISCLIGGSLHPAASEHGVEAPGNWFKDKMKRNVKNESKISAYSLQQGVVISNANQSQHARRKRIRLPHVVFPHLMQFPGHDDRCHDDSRSCERSVHVMSVRMAFQEFSSISGFCFFFLQA